MDKLPARCNTQEFKPCLKDIPVKTPLPQWELMELYFSIR